MAGTLAIAQLAGIRVFATGGIGGVHRGATFDVSADLGQLARSQLVVVCAGAKAILDIPATLEVLETYGIPVIGYKPMNFLLFIRPAVACPVTVRADLPDEIARLAKTHWEMGMASAILVAVPPPAELALDSIEVESAIQMALKEALDLNIHGQAVTPFLLQPGE